MMQRGRAIEHRSILMFRRPGMDYALRGVPLFRLFRQQLGNQLFHVFIRLDGADDPLFVDQEEGRNAVYPELLGQRMKR